MSRRKRKIRPLGHVLLDLEPLLFELIDHDLQHGDVVALVYSWLQIHAPGAAEVYINGTKPRLTYE